MSRPASWWVDTSVATFFALSGLILVRVSYASCTGDWCGLRRCNWLTTLLYLANLANTPRFGFPAAARPEASAFLHLPPE
jgi:hypothetical protein